MSGINFNATNRKVIATTDEVVIHHKNDLPGATMVGGALSHQLERRLTHRFVSNRLDAQNNVLEIDHRLAAPTNGPISLVGSVGTVVKYPGTDPMIFCSENISRIHIDKLTLDGGDNATLLDLTSTTPDNELFITDPVFQNFASLGTTNGIEGVTVTFMLVLFYQQGLVINGGVEITFAAGGWVLPPGIETVAVTVNLKTGSVVNMSNVQGRLNATHCMFDFLDNGGIVTEFALNVVGTNISGAGDLLKVGSVNEANKNSKFINNTRELTSAVIGGYFSSENVLETPITTLGEWVKITGTTIEIDSELVERTLMTDNNELTILSLEKIRLTLKAEIIATRTAASLQLFEFAFFLNGAIVNPENTLQMFTTNQGATRKLIDTFLVELDDVVEVFTRGMDTTQNVTVEFLTVNVRRAT